MKRILLIILTLSLGFFAHAFFFPDLFISTPHDVLSAKTEKDAPKLSKDAPSTQITFDGKHFSQHHITISFTRYITIINMSKDTLMNLSSAATSLATPRGYGYTEAVTMQANKKGEFTVTDTHNPQEQLVITVK